MQFCEKKTSVLSQFTKIVHSLEDESLCLTLFYWLLRLLETNLGEKFTKENELETNNVTSEDK